MPSSNKRPRIDIIKRNDILNVDYIVESTPPSLNNLEHFATEILMRIFADVDDNDLLNLTIISCRFESIANVVFNDRYADKYFRIDCESERQQEIYEQLFSRFSNGIRAIKAIDIHGIDKNHWMAQMVHKHIGSRLQKLEFRNCTYKNGCDMLLSYMEITHLTIFGGDCDDNHWIHLPKYQNLQKFELRNFQFVTELTIDWILRNNSQLESLILHHASYDFTLAKLMKYIYKYLCHLKEFIVLDHSVEVVSSQEDMEKFLNVTAGLESLGFTIYTQQSDLNEQLCANFCKNIKHLELLYNQINSTNSELNYLMEVACKFQNVEQLSLNIDYAYHDTAPILALIESLPKLKYLHIPQMMKNLAEWTLILLQRRDHLVKLVISIGDGRPDDHQMNVFHHHLNANFHGKFLNAKRKGNVKIEYLDRGRTIGCVTKKEIIWRNKLVHWIGYDPIYSKSKVNLLDLADQMANNQGLDSLHKHRSPFNLILDYLDLNSLNALQECSSRSKQIVDDYVKRHSQQGKKFLLTDEFYLNCNGLQQFAPYVKNLEVKLFDRYTSYMIKNTIGMYYENLTKLCFRTYDPIRPDEFSFPNVQHYIFCGDDC